MLRRLSNTVKDYRKSRWQRRHNPGKASQLVFVIGCQRSGTTMLTNSLGRSLEVEAYNEDDSAAFHHLRLLSFETTEKLIGQSYAKAIIFKSICETYKTKLFFEKFPRGKAIFIYRHFNDCIGSMVRVFGDKQFQQLKKWLDTDFRRFAAAPPSIEAKGLIQNLYHSGLSDASGAAVYWLFWNQFYFDLGLSRDPRVTSVQYELLVQKPEEYLRHLCDFIGITFVSSICEAVHSRSINKYPLPDIEPAIRNRCEKL
jgi:hypothetical protein